MSNKKIPNDQMKVDLTDEQREKLKQFVSEWKKRKESDKVNSDISHPKEIDFNYKNDFYLDELKEEQTVEIKAIFDNELTFNQIPLTKDYTSKIESEPFSLEKFFRPNNNEMIIEGRDLVKEYNSKAGKTRPLDKLNIDIKKGEFVSILGPSGSGKTTLLNAISALSEITDGELVVANHELSKMKNNDLTHFRSKYISFIFQRYNLLPTISLIDNIKSGEWLQKNKDERIDLKLLLKELGLEGMETKYPYQLSGGQQQRVAIGRALAKNPKILFADEPTGALDETSAKQIINLLLKSNERLKTTIVLVTHNVQLAKVADRIFYFNKGKIYKILEHTSKSKQVAINNFLN